jgi:anti-anti-sigma factor
LFRVESTETETVVWLRGELDLAAAPTLRELLLDLAQREPPTDLVLDMSEVSFVDVPALNLIGLAAQRLATRDVRLIVRNPRPFARRVICATGWGELVVEPPAS